MTNNMEYGADSIVELKFPRTVREKVGMYLGDGGQNGFFHTFVEILDNSVDEFVAGHGSLIEIEVNSKENKVSIRDYGRGIPFGINSQGVSALVLAMTTLHAGGKHKQLNGQSAYQYSSGINGVGASVVNGVSDYFYVKSIKDNKIAEITWKSGNIYKELELSENVDNLKNGTFVEWIPSVKKDEFDDNNVFESGCVFDKESVLNKLKYIPFLNIGLEIHLKFDDEIFFFKKEEHKSNILGLDNQHLVLEETPFYEEEMVLLQNKSGGNRVMTVKDMKNLNDNERSKYENEVKTSLITLAFNYSPKAEPLQLHFANGVKINGGKPDVAFKLQMKNIMNEFIQLGGSKKVFETEDIFNGLTFMLSVKINQPSFAGQTKDRLNNPESSIMTTAFMKTSLNHWINRIEKSEFEKIVKMIEIANKARLQSENIINESYKSMTSLRDSEIQAAKGKLTECSSKDKTKNELFIIEGDSAAGGIGKTRSSKYQAFLPLKGKPLNVVKKGNEDKIFKNSEILSLAYALGGIGQDFDYDKMKYNKIVILSDADLDGFHIQALLLAFFYKFYPELIKKGHVYIALAPLYKITNGKKIFWAWDKTGLDLITKDLTGKIDITRNKGLGEMNADDLFDTVLNPHNRKEIKLGIEDLQLTKDGIDTFMNDEKVGKTRLKEIISSYYKENENSLTKLHLERL